MRMTSRLLPAAVAATFAVLLPTSPPSAGHEAPAKASSPAQSVTLKGQIVCSGCWEEADRTTTPYGTKADMKCAATCAKKGIPPGLAVASSKSFELVLISSGGYEPGEGGWLAQMGKYVEAKGLLSADGAQKQLRVDALKPITPAEAGFVPPPEVAPSGASGK